VPRLLLSSTGDVTHGHGTRLWLTVYRVSFFVVGGVSPQPVAARGAARSSRRVPLTLTPVRVYPPRPVSSLSLSHLHLLSRYTNISFSNSGLRAHITPLTHFSPCAATLPSLHVNYDQHVNHISYTATFTNCQPSALSSDSEHCWPSDSTVEHRHSSGNGRKC